MRAMSIPPSYSSSSSSPAQANTVKITFYFDSVHIACVSSIKIVNQSILQNDFLNPLLVLLKRELFALSQYGGGGGFTRPIPRDGGADQFRGIPIVGRLPTDGTRGPEEKGCGRKWPDAEGLVQGSRARDVRDPVIQNHSCCKKESRLDQPCGDKS